MEPIKLEVKRLERYGRKPPLPAYQTDGAAAMDLAAFLDKPMVIEPGGRALVPTGLAIALPPAGYAAFILARSGLASRQGLTLVNGVGLIDADYRGELCVAMVNLGQEPCAIADGDRVAQLLIAPVARAEALEVEELGQTARGSGGFGSTGVSARQL